MAVYRGIYIDVNHTVEVQVTDENGKLSSDIIPSKNQQSKGLKNYISNIKQILKCEYHYNDKNEIDGIDVKLGKLKVGTISNYQKFGTIDKKTGSYEEFSLLTTTEQRLLSQGSIPYIEKFNVPFDRVKTKTPKTDLHTHLSGALTNDDMMKLGEKYNCFIPTDLLDRAGISWEQYKIDTVEVKDKKSNEIKIVKRVRFNDLKPEDREKYKDKLSIKINAQETFGAMEECYDFRDPFVKLKSDFLDKNVDLAEVLKDQLMLLAENYQKTGVEYVELSTADICKDPATFTQMLDKVMPEVESRYPDVHIKFLGGIPRVLPKKSLDKRNQGLLASAKSPYIVGLDVMAHEVNETEHFKEIIQDCVEHSQDDPDFVIRVHAGESAVHYDNVKQFLKIVKGSLIEGQKPPVIRVGHGIHGFDEETIKLCRELGAIVEINASSNVALNNIDSLNELDAKKYLDAGLKVVFGTDGHGMYSTDAKQEAVLATAMGLTQKDMEKVSEGEDKYIERMLESEERKRQAESKNKENYIRDISESIAEVAKKYKDCSSIQELAKKISEELDPENINNPTIKKFKITPEEVSYLIENNVLQLDKADMQKLTQKMPTGYYKTKYSIETEKLSELNAACDAEEKELEEHKELKHDNFVKAAESKNVHLTSLSEEIQLEKNGDGSGNKKPIFLMGYVSEDWKKLSPTNKAAVIKDATEFIASLNPEEVSLITTTEHSGFNKALIEIIKKVNPKLSVTGIVDEEQIENMSDKTRDQIFSEYSNIKIGKKNKFEYSMDLVRFLNKNGGSMVAFGEGSYLKDHLTNMHNNNGEIHLYTGKYAGKESTKVDFLQGNDYEFQSAEELTSVYSGETRPLPFSKEEKTEILREIIKNNVVLADNKNIRKYESLGEEQQNEIR